jgi:carbohydrate-binding DOMON domain-containing protein
MQGVCTNMPGRPRTNTRPLRERLWIYLLAAAILSGLGLAPQALADPFDHVNVNGVIDPDTLDWYPADLVVNDKADDGAIRSANIRRLWLTWDADSLYVGVTYQDFAPNEALRVYCDLGRGVGTANLAELDTFAGNFRFEEGQLCELVIGRPAAEAFPGASPEVHLVTDASGTTEDITSLVARAQAFNTGTLAQAQSARFAFWLNAEFAIPWSVLYGEGAPVPDYAVLKAVAVAARASATHNGIDSAPDNAGLDGGTGTVLLGNLHASVLDIDGDGTIDPADASITGTVTLPGDPGGVNVTAEAVLQGFPGRDPGAPLSTFTGTGGARQFVLARLPAGTYQITVNALGYLPATRTATVAEGERLTGVDLTLERATSISGTVGFLSLPGAAGTVRLLDEERTILSSQSFSASGGTFTFYILDGGVYTVEAEAPTFLPTDTTFTVTAGIDVTGMEIRLPRAAAVSGTVAFEGPGSAGTIRVYDAVTGDLAPGGQASFGVAGGGFTLYIYPGDYRLVIAAAGYVPVERTFNVIWNEPVPFGVLQLTAVRATRIVLTSDAGQEISRTVTTVSIPDSNLFFFAKVRLEARDENGRLDLFDIENRLAGYTLSARKLDDISPPRGNVVFATLADTTEGLETFDFTAGVASFLVRNDQVEIIRIYSNPTNPTAPRGRTVSVFKPPEPVLVVLSAARDTIRADGFDEVTISAQLFDASGNESRLSDIPVGFAVDPASIGAGFFQVPTVLTNADGLATAVLSATGAGALDITCSVTFNNVLLEVRAETVGGPGTLALTVLPGPATEWRLSPAAHLVGLADPVGVTAQLVDAYGNAVNRPGESITFTANPPSLGNFAPPTATSNQNGRALASYTPAGLAGAVMLGGTSPAFPVIGAEIELRNIMVVPDPPYYEEPRTRRTFPPADLTALVVNNDAENLLLEVPFVSSWGGLQIHVVFETEFNAEGATSDPFLQPVNYGHALLPDYALTFKYSANDYGDFRRWNSVSDSWEWWQLDSQQYVAENPAGQNVLGAWVQKTSIGLSMRIPWEPFGERPDSLRLELYLTQDDGVVKRSAFDSAPQDSTLDLDFDYLNPGPADWNAALGPVTLGAWSRAYVVKTEFPAAPTIADAAVAPQRLNAGEPFTLTARVTDAGGGIGDVLASLSALTGSSAARMRDDGAQGDVTAGDGIYTLRSLVPLASPGGEQPIVIRAFEASNESAQSSTVTIDVIASVEVILSAPDPVGDDHGPNQKGEERKYYTYPTNAVFVPGSFDLTALRIYETVAVVGGSPIDVIAFEVGIADFPNPDDPGTADWNPPYGELNVEKIDIMIDSAPGGATRGFPNRRIDFEPWDAWDYAIVMDGWYKAVIPSLGQNTAESWRQNALRNDRDITIVGNPDLNTVTALIGKATLGNPTLDEIRKWDIAVVMASHDIGDDENDFGGIRWVNESRSEWNFGGGYFNDQDANVMDLLLVAGVGKSPGRLQEELLDYESSEAIQRLANGQTPVAVEMTEFEDTGPPIIRLESTELVSRTPLQEAPLNFTGEITDDFLVDRALFRYRPSNLSGSGWSVEEAMGFVGGSIWSVDLLPNWLDANLVSSPVDSSRYLEFQIVAFDHLGKQTVSPIVTMEIRPAQPCLGLTAEVSPNDLSYRTVDGTSLVLPAALLSALPQIVGDTPWDGDPLPADTLAVYLDMCVLPPAIRAAQPVPGGRALGVFRQLRLVRVDPAGGSVILDGNLPNLIDVALHYPQAWFPGDPNKPGAENRIGLYEYHERSDRWVLIGGNVNPHGNVVTARVNHLGLFGLFLSQEIDFDPNKVISGVMISPNPFSPNGDALYDETNISFFLNQEATVTAEIYNIEGNRQRIITENFSYSGEESAGRVPRRVPGLIWDGNDQKGDPVPYGIYIIRLVVTYNQAGGTRSIRSNHSVAVIR